MAPTMTLDPTDRALLRGWLQGLPWLVLSDVYQPDQLPSATKAHTEALVETLVARARRAGRDDLAARLAGGPLVSERWQTQADAAIDAILELPEPRPAPSDPVGRWFPGRIEAPLARAGIATLADIAQAAELADWWRAIPRIGEDGAETLRQFFARSPELGPLPEIVVEPPPAPERPPRTDVAPLEYFRAPELLSGRDRTNRQPPERQRIQADTDAEAVGCWLAQWPEDSATRRAYRKEAERFLLWSLLERGKPLSGLGVDDAIAYRQFVRDPQPRERWVGPLAARRAPGWKPFQDGLSERSAQFAETVLRSLCQWLVEVGYLAWSPFGGLRRARRSEEGMAVGRALSEREWRWVMDYCAGKLAEPGADTAYYRHARFALRFGYATGLRISNLAAATLGDLERREGRDGAKWWLHCRVKGDKPHRVPVTALLGELREYLGFRGYDAPLEALDPDIPLIGKRRRTRTGRKTYREVAYSPAGLHDLFRSLFGEAGAALEPVDPVAAARLRASTAHVLRHTHATHALERGVPITVAQRNLGHASLAVTSRYLTVDDDRHHEEIGKLLDPGAEPA
ncbi:integrase (plasmid) [Methylomagnum ishizawai]|nr:integrase [Methylomagnum ishizawai]